MDFFDVGEQVADDRLVMDLGDDTDLGDCKLILDLNGVVSFVDFEVDRKVWSLSDDWDIPDGRLIPLFLLCSNSIFFPGFFLDFSIEWFEMTISL